MQPPQGGHVCPKVGVKKRQYCHLSSFLFYTEGSKELLAFEHLKTPPASSSHGRHFSSPVPERQLPHKQKAFIISIQATHHSSPSSPISPCFTSSPSSPWFTSSPSSPCFHMHAGLFDPHSYDPPCHFSLSPLPRCLRCCRRSSFPASATFLKIEPMPFPHS